MQADIIDTVIRARGDSIKHPRRLLFGVSFRAQLSLAAVPYHNDPRTLDNTMICSPRPAICNVEYLQRKGFQRSLALTYRTMQRKSPHLYIGLGAETPARKHRRRARNALIFW